MIGKSNQIQIILLNIKNHIISGSSKTYSRTVTAKVYIEPNSAIHSSYFFRSSLLTDLLTFLMARRKSSIVVGKFSSSTVEILSVTMV